MMDRQRGKIVFECDSCNAVFDSETSDFTDAKLMLDRDGWKAKKIGNDWVHGCPRHPPA